MKPDFVKFKLENENYLGLISRWGYVFNLNFFKKTIVTTRFKIFIEKLVSYLFVNCQPPTANCVLIAVFWLLSQSIFAQQLPIFTQYREHHSYVNPAAVGWDYFTYKYNFNVGISHRNQWAEIEHHPKVQHLHGEYILRGKGNFSLLTGLNFIKQSTDPFYRTGTYGRAVVLFTDNPYYFGIAAGFMAGGVSYRLKIRDLLTMEDEPILSNIQLDELKNFRPDVGLGVYFYKQFRKGILKGDNLYGGFSVPQILSLKAHGNEDLVKTKPHFFGVLGYYRYLNQDSFLEPSVWIKTTPNAPLNFDFNLRFQYANIFWVGSGFSTNDSVIFEAGVLVGENFNLNRLLKIGYGASLFLKENIQNEFGTTHEINLAFSMDVRKKK